MHSRPSLHPSAEDFLRQLILFIDSHGSELLSSKDAFKLQPRALEYVSLRLEGLCQLQRVKVSNPIRFLAGAVADLTDFLRMEKVQQFCSLVKYLKLYSSAQDIRDPTPINFSPFKSVATLEIRGCDLSSVCPRGIGNIRSTVECIVCQASLECLWHLLEPNKLEEEESSVSHRWTKLKRLSCIYNDMKEMDASLRLVPNVTVLDFSRNRIARAEHLSDLPNLTALDLSFNRLSDLGEIPMSRRLQRLFLQSNQIRTLDGIRNLEQLEELDLRWNVISQLSEVAKLKPLTALRLVSLAGNPINASQNYRLNVLACLLEWREDVVLDARPPSEVELKKARRITVTHDGCVEINPADYAADSQTPLSLWEIVIPFCRPFRKGRRDASNSENSLPLLSDEETVTRPPQRPRPVKRIVNLPDVTYQRLDKIDIVDTRLIPRMNLLRVHAHSREHGQFNGSYDESRFGSLGAV